MGYFFGSEEDLKSGGNGGKDFKLVAEDIYIAEVSDIEVQTGKTNKWNPDPHDEWQIRFRLISLVDGSPIVFADGTEPDPNTTIKLRTWIDPAKKGMIPRPSKARVFLAAALGVPVGSRIEFNSLDDLLGKRLRINVVHKPDGQGVLRDRIESFSPARTKPFPKQTDAEVIAETSRKIFVDEVDF